MSFSLEDLLEADGQSAIRTKIHRSKVFAKILGWIYIKTCQQRASSVRCIEIARGLHMDPWQVGRTLQVMVAMGLLRKIVRNQKIVLYIPEENSGNPILAGYLPDIKKSLGVVG